MTGARLVLADDDALARSALRELLCVERGVGRVIECEAHEQLRLALQTRTDLVLLADSLEPGADYPICRESSQSAPVLVLARGPAQAMLLPALKAGALGVVAMTSTYADLVRSVRSALRGEACVPPGLLGSLLRDLIDQRRRDDQVLTRYQRLSERERGVLAALVRGSDVPDIAADLVLSRQTVRSHLQHVLTKLEVHSRAEAVGLALEHDLLGPPIEGQP